MVEIEHAEDVFRAFFEKAPGGKAVTGVDGSWRHVNAALVAMFGYSAEELRATSFVALTHPDDLVETGEAVRRLLSGEAASCSFEKRFRAKDGA